MTPSTAAACWDGISLKTERLSASIYDESAEWSVDEAHRYANWMARVEALLPEGVEASYFFGGFEFTGAGDLCELAVSADFDGSIEFNEVFDVVARSCGSTKAEIKAARAIEAPVYTVQLLSTSDEDAAKSAAYAINDLGEYWHGFYEVGGFPDTNPSAHVEPATLDDGRVVYRVIVGAFTSAAAAKATRADIQATLGREGMVRRL
ncbi:SPOR domain-containing protein [Enhygromyxa salina]|uniref:SPOR domain-containing protein n=1 Tax=Enhygromyxa salina TaxID=215803 RepID=UPI0015E5CD1F|nr:SPOR domain-containing protein [Enhygromyxa salina]